MQSRTVERVEAWESRPFAGGADALADLADADFSGAVVADDTWLFFVNGRAVGVYDGVVADLDAAGTRYEAPDISLPLLFAMREADGETQAQYYTNDTPISDTDETLRDANFTGYLELSENVLSGDYYVVYYGGRSFAAAFVGNTPKVLSGDEAFERADDEVGVYDVVSVALDFPDLPEPETPAEQTTVAATTPDAEDESDDEPDDAAESTAAADAVEAAEPDTAADAVEAAEPDTAATEPDEPDRGARPDDAATDEAAADERTAREPPTASADGDDRDGQRTVDDSGRDDAVASAEPAERPGAESSKSERVEEAPAASADEDDAEVFAEEAAWRETTTVPTLAPDEDGGASAGRAAEDGSNAAARSRGQSARSSAPDERASERNASTGRGETVERLEAAVREREARIEALESRLDETEDDLAERERELADVREERDDLRETVARLEERIETLESESAGGVGGGADDLTPAAALAGTNLFVRYDSKADPTLEDVGEADADAIDANVSLEHHTTFDADAATVDGEAYDAFLRETAAYRFVSWVVRELPFELRETGHQSGLAGLYDAVPELDRAELAGTVTVEDEEGSGVSREFDVVFRDRMGNPLAVAELNTSRDPVSGEAMEALRDDATAVSELSETLGSALYVTSSFFEPDALSAADEAADSGGLLGRSDKESYVKVARKRGYHLCLVEDRNGSFHLTVPQI